ncbi:MAG TPA: MFS transporter [Rhizomicrobium sp.]
MAYFRNRVVNLLNLHYGIFSVVITGGGAFYCVYLLKAGVSLPGVLAAMAAILLVRFAVRPFVVGLAVRFGLQRLLVAGTLLMALQYPLIAEVHGIGLRLLPLILVSAIGDAVYWSCYHAYFAALGDDEHRGHQVSMREAIAAAVGIVSPLLIGWILVRFGARAAFGMASLVMLVAAVPLLWTPQVTVAREAPGAFKAAWPGIKLFLADGWIASGLVFVWQLALFLSLGENFINYGGALALAALAGAIAGLFLGRHIDAGHGGRAVMFATGPLVVMLLLRAASAGHPALAVAANALVSICNCLYMPTLMTAVYTLAKRSPCTLRFHVATEGGWDAGGAGGCVIAALLLYFGVPISLVLLLPLIGVAAAFVLLRGYYADAAPAEV